MSLDRISEVTAHEQPGVRIGRYKLLQVIGQGGFGVVWMAEQEEPVRRRVALKVLKLGMDTKAVVARFEAERQALALMDHPGIAKVLDGGATESGRPYFVMELVHGVPITKFCDERKLSPTARLELFRKVCAAVQHAHQKGVIHRDLKPNNVLVGEHDGVPAPKVIDFGIAKATAGSLTELTLVTEYRQMIGTPEYMAPEQASVSGLDIDTRADIYSLGVLLYELLTGTKPFELKTVSEQGYDEVLRYIREVEPPKPSTRISSLGEGITTVAERRALEPQQLRHTIRGDLDWIAMKALEKERSRRYDSAIALADDVGRYLADQPVLASPPSTVYRLRKYVRRHRFGVAAGLAIAVALIVGLVATTLALWRARDAEARVRTQFAAAEDARKIADEQRTAAQASEREAREAREAENAARLAAQDNAARARSEAAKSEQVARFLGDMLKSVGPSVALGRDTALLDEILGRTVERMSTELAGQPAVEADLRAIIGDIYRQLGRHRAAEAMHREALRLRRETDGAESVSVAISLNDLGLALYSGGDLADAEPLFTQAIELLRRVAPDREVELIAMESNLAAVQTRLGKYEPAERTFREVLALQRRISGGDDDQVATSLNNLGALLRSKGDLAGAEETLREALETTRNVIGERSPAAATAAVNLATVLRARGELDEAESLLRDALDIERDVYADDHPEIATVLNNLACVLYDRGQLDQAEPLFEQALERRRAHFGADNLEVARPLDWLATIALDRGDAQRAEKLSREAASIYERQLGLDSPDTIDAVDHHGHALEACARLDEAEEALRRSFEASQRTPGDRLRGSPHRFCYANILQRRGRWVPAESALLVLWKRVESEPDSSSARGVAEQLATLYERWNQAEPDPARVAQAKRWRASAGK